MAYRRSRGKPTKIQPAVLTMRFTSPTITGGDIGSFYIDLSQCASILNRRFYRQGISWAVDSIKILTPAAMTGTISVQSLPTTWVMSNAWEKGFRAWQQMIKNATEESGSASIKGKFLDFKIYADARHHKLGYGANLMPFTMKETAAGVDSLVAAVPGQWQSSEYVMPIPGAAGTTNREIMAVGPNLPGAGASTLDAFSLVQGYADSRRLPYSEDPAVPADADTNWLVKLFQGGTEQDQDVITELEALGDEAPYPYEGDGTHTDTMYPGGETQLNALQLNDTETVSPTTIGGVTRLRGGVFPCGLMKFVVENSGATSNMGIQINLVPGKHRGYLCEPMTEM